MKHISLSLLAVAALCCCSKEVQEFPAPPHDGVIRAFAGVETPGTKAVVTQATGLSGVTFRLIHAFALPTDFTTATALTGNIAATSGAITFSPDQHYDQVDDYTAWMIGYYPAGTLNGNTVTWDIDGATDILRTETVWDGGKYSGPRTTGMTFKHQLSQVEVVCEAVSGAALSAVQAAWGPVKSISFVDAPTTMTYDYATLTTTNGTVGGVKPLLADYDGTAVSAFDIPVNGSTVINAAAMLAPVGRLDNTISFKLLVVTDGPTADAGDDITSTVNVKIGASDAEDMTRGKTHKVTLTFRIDGQQITANATTIDQWEAGATGSGNVEKP